MSTRCGRGPPTSPIPLPRSLPACPTSVGLDNPSGMLADHNPDVGACEPDAGAQHHTGGQ
jgi:hypothetical protein